MAAASKTPAKKIIYKPEQIVTPYSTLEILGLYSTAADYEIAYNINKILKIDLVKTEDFQAYNRNSESKIKDVMTLDLFSADDTSAPTSHAMFYCNDEALRVEHILFSNTERGNYILKEQRQKTPDYILLLRGNGVSEIRYKYLSGLSTIPGVTKATRINFSHINDIETVLEEIESHFIEIDCKSRQHEEEILRSLERD